MIGLFDPLYWILVGPTMLIAGWATMRVKSTFHRFARTGVRSGMTGAQAAAAVARARVEVVRGKIAEARRRLAEESRGSVAGAMRPNGQGERDREVRFHCGLSRSGLFIVEGISA